MRIYGVWIYGAMALTMLAVAGFFYGQKEVVLLTIMSAGFAYAAEFAAHWCDLNGWSPAKFKFQTMLVVASVGSGVAAFFMATGLI